MANNFQSEFVFGLQGKRYEEFVDIVAKPIIEKIVGTNDYKIIGFDKHLSDMDFDNEKRKESIFPEFYLNFLGDIAKDDNGVFFKKKICITLDERLCNDICPNTSRKITYIKIAGVELVYFIYFDVKEFFDFVYNFDREEFLNSQIQNDFYERDVETNKKESLEISTSNSNDDKDIGLSDIDLSKFFLEKKRS